MNYFQNLQQLRALSNDKSLSQMAFQYIEKFDEKKQKELLILFMEDDLEEFLTFLMLHYKKVSPHIMDLIYQTLVELYDYENIEVAKNLVDHYHTMYTIYQQRLHHQKKYTLEELYKDNQVPTLDKQKALIAHYFQMHHYTMSHYLQNKTIYTLLNTIIDNTDHDITYKQECGTLYQLYQQEQEEENSRKIHRIIQKSYKKLNTILNKYDHPQKQVQELTELSTFTKNKLSQLLSTTSFYEYLDIQEFFEHIDSICHDLADFHEEEKIDPIIIPTNDIQMIKDYCKTHHIHTHESKIIAMLEESPYTIDFFKRYNKIQTKKDEETKLNLLEELKADILESDSRQESLIVSLLQAIEKLMQECVQKSTLSSPTENQESIEEIKKFFKTQTKTYDYQQVLKLISLDKECMTYFKSYNELLNLPSLIAYKELRDVLLESPIIDHPYGLLLLKNIDQQILNYQTQNNDPETLINIGKHVIIKETEKANPLSVSNLLQYMVNMKDDDKKKVNQLILTIGYDQVEAYLLKHPNLTIEQLTSIIQTDRQLRLAFRLILEDIEMYFRSSFSFYLTNKYDKKYQRLHAPGYFYGRGYLTKNIFTDRDEHYQLINQLNERIDIERKENNQQIINEYNKNQNAISFTTATGIMPFGWILNLFQILNYYDKSEYLMHYFKGISAQSFYSWMMSLNNLRNLCAHYHSLYRLSSLKDLRPIMTKSIDANEIDDQYSRSSLFYYTIIMARLAPDTTHLEDFNDQLLLLFRQAARHNNTFQLETDYSFPKHWYSILEKEKGTKIGPHS